MSPEVDLPLEIERYIFELCASSSDKPQQLVLMLVAKKVYDWIRPVFYSAIEIQLSLKNWRSGWDRYKSLTRSRGNARVKRLFTSNLRSLRFDVSWQIGVMPYNTQERAEALMKVFSKSRPTHLFLDLPEHIFETDWGTIQKTVFSFPVTHLDLGYFTSWVLCYPDMVERLPSCAVVDTVTHLSLYAHGNSPQGMIDNLLVFRALTHVALYVVSHWKPPIESIRTLPKSLASKAVVVLVEPVHRIRGYGTWKTEDWLTPESHPNVAFFSEEYSLPIIHDPSIWERAEAQLKMQNESK